MKKILTLLIALSLASYALSNQPNGSKYISGNISKTGLVLAHGKGKHPTWLVVNPVRKGVNKKLGYHTLSLQMPTGNIDWQDYALDFPDAYNTIKQGIVFLKEKGVTKIFLFGHSMGSRMSSAFVAENPNQNLSGLIVAGCRNNGDPPLSCDHNLGGVSIPILDVWGGNNSKDVDSAHDRNNMVSNTYKQVEILSANHKFQGYEDELVDIVTTWLQQN